MENEEAGLTGLHLNQLLQQAGMAPLGPETARKFDAYLSLFVRWNARINLSSVRDPEEILVRHFVESITCARALPSNISTLLDFGSGGGLPGIPIALSRPEIAVTLAESQGKKAAFLQEAVRVLGIPTRVFAGRGETLSQQFDCVVLRAVDKMADAVHSAAHLVQLGGCLALMTTSVDGPRLQSAVGEGYKWGEELPLPGSTDRILLRGVRVV
jgi:16S rRNA (guanine527-N7)-methyltransferase